MQQQPKQKQASPAKKSTSRRKRQNSDGNRPSRTVSLPVARVTQTSVRPAKGLPDIAPISHEEYVGDIVGSTGAFSIAYSSGINPGLANLFPWLSSTAINYEAYRFKKLQFKYKNRTTTANTGFVTIGVDYDSGDATPTSKLQINNWKSSVSFVPSVDFTFNATVSDMSRMKRYLTRDSAVSGEITSFDVGALYVIVGGNITNTNIGELWISYDIDLYTPQLKVPGAPLPRSNSVFVSAADQALVTATNTQLLLATQKYNPLGFLNTAGAFTGPTGVYTVYAQQTISAATLTTGYIGISVNGADFIRAVYPPLLNGFSTMNAETVVALSTGDILRVVVNVSGTVLVATSGGGINGILVITSA